MNSIYRHIQSVQAHPRIDPADHGFGPLWAELHPRPRPIAHPIPRLTLAPVPAGDSVGTTFARLTSGSRFASVRAILRPAAASALGRVARRGPARLLPAALVALAVSGCTVLRYHGANGEQFSRCTLGANTAIASLTVETGSNGLRRVEMRGYQNESTQAIGAITEAAVRGAVRGAN